MGSPLGAPAGLFAVLVLLLAAPAVADREDRGSAPGDFWDGVDVHPDEDSTGALVKAWGAEGTSNEDIVSDEKEADNVEEEEEEEKKVSGGNDSPLVKDKAAKGGQMDAEDADSDVKAADQDLGKAEAAEGDGRRGAEDGETAKIGEGKLLSDEEEEAGGRVVWPPAAPAKTDEEDEADALAKQQLLSKKEEEGSGHVAEIAGTKMLSDANAAVKTQQNTEASASQDSWQEAVSKMLSGSDATMKTQQSTEATVSQGSGHATDSKTLSSANSAVTSQQSTEASASQGSGHVSNSKTLSGADAVAKTQQNMEVSVSQGRMRSSSDTAANTQQRKASTLQARQDFCIKAPSSCRTADGGRITSLANRILEDCAIWAEAVTAVTEVDRSGNNIEVQCGTTEEAEAACKACIEQQRVVYTENHEVKTCEVATAPEGWWLQRRC